ncbi:MAG TPA: ATP-binding protein, partial [Bryobacteraceae bacterium]|nr:ATP-binding protein [Bryobacteraceae bacterium]
AFILLDLHGRVTGWNTGAERLFGYAADEIMAEHGSRIFTPEDVAKGEEVRERQTALQNGRAEDQRWHVRKNGTRFWSSGVVTPVQDDSGRVFGFAKVLRDITEHRQAEESLAAQAEELIRSNAELQQFAYVTSHDLQEPLRTVSTFSELLRRTYRGKLGPEADEYLDVVAAAVERMNALIRDLLEYSRTGRSSAAPAKPTSLDGVLQWTLHNLQAAIQETNAVVTNDPLPTVLGSEVQLLQVFQNLIGNSLKYHGDVPVRIHISAGREGDCWRISVSDNGIGIAAQYHERIFGIFKRLHGREVPGTGIGLALCRRIVENHGGRIWVESDSGAVAQCFTLRSGQPTSSWSRLTFRCSATHPGSHVTHFDYPHTARCATYKNAVCGSKRTGAARGVRPDITVAITPDSLLARLPGD